ncbi:MAG: shikimate kinase [Leptolyngbyaceae cyanobacterium SU_3_3]|nr:shikimate kinase [Leptolyngbyaceae cyanobacterium SU_3_3]
MELLFIYGPAAAGKLTIGRELAKRTGFRLFHNHLTVDAVMAVFDFGSEPFIKLREQIWLSVFKEAAQNDVSLIFTFSPERTVRTSFIQDALDAVEPFGGKVRFIELICPIEELERRIENPSRAEFNKLRSLEGFRKIRQAGKHIYPKLPNSGLTIDTSKTSPQEAAHKILEFFSLNWKIEVD